MSGTGKSPKERRKARRVSTDFGVQLVGLGTPEIEAQVVNLSGGGFMALTPRYFSPITKFAMTLVLPPFSLPEDELPVESGKEAGAPGEPERIQAEGMVVRCESAGGTPERFSVAVAFLHLTPADHRRIEGYVQWRFERSLLESADA